MSADCGLWIAKYILCIFNFFFFVSGTIVLSVGIWLAIDKASLIALTKIADSENINHFTQPAVIEQMAYVLIVCGAIMFVLSFLGYCGAIQESKCLLTTYGIFMILLLITEFTVNGLAAAYKDRTRSETKSFLQSTITKYYSTGEHTDAVTLMWDQMMGTFSCCGVENYRDFESSESWIANKQNRTIPEACCVLTDVAKSIPRDENCTTNPTDGNSYFEKGCYDAFIDWILLHKEIVLGVLLGVGIVQLLAIFLAFCLCKSIAKYHGMRL